MFEKSKHVLEPDDLKPGVQHHFEHDIYIPRLPEHVSVHCTGNVTVGNLGGYSALTCDKDITVFGTDHARRVSVQARGDIIFQHFPPVEINATTECGSIYLKSGGTLMLSSPEKAVLLAEQGDIIFDKQCNGNAALQAPLGKIIVKNGNLVCKALETSHLTIADGDLGCPDAKVGKGGAFISRSTTRNTKLMVEGGGVEIGMDVAPDCTVIVQDGNTKISQMVGKNSTIIVWNGNLKVGDSINRDVLASVANGNATITNNIERGAVVKALGDINAGIAESGSYCEMGGTFTGNTEAAIVREHATILDFENKPNRLETLFSRLRLHVPGVKGR